MLITLHLTAVITLACLSKATSSSSPATSAPTGAVFASGFDITRNWAQFSPYQEVNSFNASKGVPSGCALSQAHVLHRHAQRYPTVYYLEGGETEIFRQKIDNYRKVYPNTSIGNGPLSFLNQWVYMFGGKDTLLTAGTATEVVAGADFWTEYGRLLYHAGPNVPAWNESLNVFHNGTKRPKPVFRTTTESRILESARWWLSGFFGNTAANSSYDQYELVVIPEAAGINNTLATYNACPGDTNEGANEITVTWIPKFTEAARTRLSAFLPPDFNLTSLNVFAMMSLCPYEQAALGRSPFCSLFTEQEWRDYDYASDLQFYGDYAFGAPSGRAQGIGYVLELAARLEGKLIYSTDTGINIDYDNNEAQFPLHQPVYMDMSHDDVIISVLTALGLDYFKYGPGPGGLPASTIDHAVPHTFRINQVTPYGARLTTEVWTCPSNTRFTELDTVIYINPDLSSTPGTIDYIRFVLNGAPITLDGLIGCEHSENGFCEVNSFLRGVPQLKEQAEYQYACSGNYTTGKQVSNGTPP